MKVGALRNVVIGVSDLNAALGVFRDVIGLRVEHEGAASPALRSLWGMPESAAVHLVELSFDGYPIGRLTLLHTSEPLPGRMRDDHGGGDSGTDVGPKAVDFYVYKPMDEALRELEAAGCIPRSQPVRHAFAEYESEELVISGPDGVPFLIMKGHKHPASSLRTGLREGGFSEIPTVSVVTGSLDATHAFYGGVLGMWMGTNDPVPPEMNERVCDLVGVPAGTQIHFLIYQEEGEPSGKYLFPCFFEASKRRLAGRMRPGRLGVSVYSHMVEGFDELLTRLRAAARRIFSGPALVEHVWLGERRTVLVEGPNEELLEFVEA